MAVAAAQGNAGLNAMFDDALRAQMHTGYPGASGTANQFGDTTRQVVTWSPAAAAAKLASNTPTWATVTAAGLVTHLSFWTTGGVYRGSMQLLVPKNLAIGEGIIFVELRWNITVDT
jgi:hypothetical protein